MEENKYIVALGYISTCVPEMIIDVENPLDMMKQVYGKFDQLCARIAELEAERDALKAELDAIRQAHRAAYRQEDDGK